MDILIHAFSGLAVGTVVSSFADVGCKERAGIILLSGGAAAMPDIDAVSLWSQFDSTIGPFFNLTEPGKKIYSAQYWYSHHGLMHSAAAALMWTILLSLFGLLIRTKGKLSDKKAVLLAPSPHNTTSSRTTH